MESSLTLLSRAKHELSKVVTLDDAKDIRDKAEAIRHYLKQSQDSLDAQNYAAEVRIRAERRMGEMLADGIDHKGGRPEKNGDTVSPFSLNSLGIHKKASSRWQSIASIPDEQFDAKVRETVEAKKELTSSAFLKLAKKLKNGEPEPKEVTILDLISDARQCIRDLRDRFGDDEATLIGILQDEIEDMEAENGSD